MVRSFRSPQYRHLISAAFALSLSACGGSQASSRTADDDPERDSDDNNPDARVDSSEQPRGPDCDDGTCFTCGDGLCPRGFYCDENVQGGPACSWLPECADGASCGCVTGILGSSCSCDDREGGAHVSCG